MNPKMIALCLSTLLGCSQTNAQTPSGPIAMHDATRLDALRRLEITDGKLTFAGRDESSVLHLPDDREIKNLPPRTVVRITLHPVEGSNINVEIWLPDAERWNGRLLGQGNGGSAGMIRTESLAWSIPGGYAVAHTDMGTSPNADSGVGNPEVWKDFGYRATHLMTVVAKQVVAAFYGRPPEFSYFNGGSTGGQQALQEAQRYPEDYDGIVAAIPAHCRTPLHAYFLWNFQILQNCPFSQSQEAAVIAAGNEYMAARETPPVAGKFVSDPRCDAQDIEAVVALALKKDPTLTPAHAGALRQLFEGPRHAVTGERIFNGVPFGSSFESAQGNLYLFKWVFGPHRRMEDIDFGADIDAYTAALGPYLNAENPDLSAFAARGGKLLINVGSADAIVPYHATVDYYERVIARSGGLDATRAFARLYIIPGMGHGGGPGISHPPDMLAAVRVWREKGDVPHALVGRRIVEQKTELEMPLYPYPAKTGWDARTASFTPVDGPRGGVERVAERFRPAAAE